MTKENLIRINNKTIQIIKKLPFLESRSLEIFETFCEMKDVNLSIEKQYTILIQRLRNVTQTNYPYIVEYAINSIVSFLVSDEKIMLECLYPNFVLDFISDNQNFEKELKNLFGKRNLKKIENYLKTQYDVSNFIANTYFDYQYKTALLDLEKVLKLSLQSQILESKFDEIKIETQKTKTYKLNYLHYSFIKLNTFFKNIKLLGK